MMRRAMLAFSVVVALALAGCTAAAPEARPVTAEEAQLLAIARFNSFDAGTRAFSTSVTERGVDLHVQGWVDYAAERGYAAVTGEFDAQALVWDQSRIGIITQAPDPQGFAVLPVPDLDAPEMASDDLDPSQSRLDAVLSVISSLGTDRPDNPLLLQQSGALWLREDTVSGDEVTVFAAPPSDAPRDASSPPLEPDSASLRLWVDAAGVLRRAQARFGTEWITISFSTKPGPSLAPSPQEPSPQDPSDG